MIVQEEEDMVEGLWDEEIDTLKSLDNKILHIVEEKLQLELPADYVSLMKQQNGGRLAKTLYNTDEEEIYIEEILGISEEEAEGILTTLYLREEWDLPDDIILLSGDGHSWVFLDYRINKSQPSVSYIDLEMEKDYVLAANFTDFIKGLYVDEAMGKTVDGAEGVYSEEAFEQIVDEAVDAFALTDGVLYFTEIDCDMEWLLSQVIRIMDIDNDESEFVLPEVLDYVMVKMLTTTISDEANEILKLLVPKIKTHPLQEVRNFYKSMKEFIQ